MFVVQVIGQWNHALIPGVPFPALVAADEQDGHASRVKRKQHLQVATARTKLFHVCVPRAADGIHKRPSQGRTLGLQMVDSEIDRPLLPFGQSLAPGEELLGVLHIPWHNLI